jgi:ferric enterobactin receptor
MVMATGGNMNQSFGSNLTLRKGKLSTTFSGNVYQYRNIQEGSTRRVALQDGQPVNILTRSTEADNTGTGAYAELGIDYDPDSSRHFNASAMGWGGDFPNDNSISNLLTDPAGNSLQSFRTESRFKNPYGNGQVNLGYTKTYRTEREFSLLAQYSRMPDNYFYTTDRYENEVVTYREKSTNYSRNEEYTVQADYVYPLALKGRKDTAKGKLELGAKSIIRDIGSDYRVEVSPDGQGDL